MTRGNQFSQEWGGRYFTRPITYNKPRLSYHRFYYHYHQGSWDDIKKRAIDLKHRIAN